MPTTSRAALSHGCPMPVVKGGKRVRQWNRCAGAVRGRNRGESSGNGAAMRVAPIGLLRWDDPVLLRAEAILSALPTHR